jgi:hypothetical protein
VGSLTHDTLPGWGGINIFCSGHRDGNGPVTIFEWNAVAEKIEPKVTVG